MITSDDDRRFDRTGLHQMIDPFAKHRALAVSEPTDPSRQSLETHLLACQTNPAAENLVFGKKLQNKIIRELNVTRISRQRRPPERTAPFCKHWTDIGGNEAWEVVGVFHTTFKRDGSDIVSVIERHRAALLHFEQRVNVNGNRFDRALNIALWIGFTKFRGPRGRQSARNVTIERIVRACLIRNNIGNPSAPNHFGKNIGAVSKQANR